MGSWVLYKIKPICSAAPSVWYGAAFVPLPVVSLPLLLDTNTPQESATAPSFIAGSQLPGAEPPVPLVPLLDELVGVGAVDLRARRAAGGTAGLTGDRQHPAGFAGGRVAVQ